MFHENKGGTNFPSGELLHPFQRYADFVDREGLGQHWRTRMPLRRSLELIAACEEERYSPIAERVGNRPDRRAIAQVDIENGDLDAAIFDPGERILNAVDAGHDPMAQAVHHVFQKHPDERFILDDED
jgi:hypothetical protein